MKNIKLIIAIAEDGTVGTKNLQENGFYMPWHISTDLARFRTLTKGATVVMGRTTWETIPEQYRPLKFRDNVVMSTNPNFIAPGASIFTRDEVLEYAEANPDETVWIIGGPSIYRLFVNYVEELHITRVHQYYGDNPNIVKGGLELLQLLGVDPAFQSNDTWEVTAKDRLLKSENDSEGTTYAVFKRKLEK